MRTRWMVPVCALLLAGPLGAQEVQAPTGVTVDRVASGLALFHGKGGCDACHGQLALGTPDGPGLTGGQWKLGPGTIDWLEHITRHAGWGMTGRGGDAKPMRGPTVLDSTEVNMVAAYVWTISRGRGVQPPN
jgi:mono/diheme cytochrome c family protein